ncbi:hypothetical protein [Microbacterium hydrothermale]|uniref:hypothetical protein n=1 Tax=Microbacterium hydrothermale TaxID=857427 RepID=UPI0010A8342E|nr:hypothetical protein [Microbacterium hydrothermale]
MRRQVLSARAVFEGMVALVAAVATALTVAVLALTATAADAGAREVLAAGAGAETGLDLSLPLAVDAAQQDARVRDALERLLPTDATVTIDRVETAGLIDLGRGRGYLAGDGGDALPLAAGRWPAASDEAALPAVVAEELGIGLGDTVDLGVGRVTVTALWASSPAAADRWFGVRAASATGGGEGPLAVASSVLASAASSAGLDRRAHWSIHLGADGTGVSTVRDVAAAWRGLPDALTAEGVDTADLETAGALIPTAQRIASRAAVLEAAAPVALVTAILAALAVSALFAALLVDAAAPERRIRWARGQASALIVRSEAGRALTAGLVGAAVGATASTLVLAPPTALVPAVVAVACASAAAPAALTAAYVAADLRRLTRGGAAAAPLAVRWTTGIAASVVVLLAALTTARAISLGSTLGQGRSGPELDPLAVVAPAALLLALVVIGAVAVVVLPRRLRERRASDATVGPFLAATTAARRPLTSGAVIVLVAAAVGQMTFAAMYQATWNSAFATAVAVQEGARHRVSSDGDDLTPAVLDRIVAASGGGGVAPVWTANTSIAARSATLVMAGAAAVASLADPALEDLDRVVGAMRTEVAGPVVPTGASTLSVEVDVRDAQAAVVSVALLDDWGRLRAVTPDASGAIPVPPVAIGPGGSWRVAAVDVAVTAAEPSGASVSIEGLSAGGESLSLGGSVMPVDVSADAIDLQASPGPASVAVSDDVTRVRFVPVSPSAPVVVSQAFAQASGVGEGDTLPVSLVAGAESRPVRIAAVVPAIPGAVLSSAVLVDAGAVMSSRLRAFTALPGAASAWIPAPSDTAAVAAVLPDDARLTGSSRDQGRTVLSTASTLLWCGAVGATVFSAVGLGAVALSARRRRRGEVLSLRAIGVDAATRRRIRMQEAVTAVVAGTVVGVVAGVGSGILLLPAVVAGALPRAVGVVVTADPFVAAATVGAVVAIALASAGGFAAVDDLRARRSGR